MVCLISLDPLFKYMSPVSNYSNSEIDLKNLNGVIDLLYCASYNHYKVLIIKILDEIMKSMLHVMK